MGLSGTVMDVKYVGVTMPLVCIIGESPETKNLKKDSTQCHIRAFAFRHGEERASGAINIETVSKHDNVILELVISIRQGHLQ